MKWEDIRQKYIDEWIIIEAINARTEDGNRIVEELTIVDTFDNDNNGALRKYVELHHQPLRQARRQDVDPRVPRQADHQEADRSPNGLR